MEKMRLLYCDGNFDGTISVSYLEVLNHLEEFDVVVVEDPQIDVGVNDAILVVYVRDVQVIYKIERILSNDFNYYGKLNSDDGDDLVVIEMVQNANCFPMAALRDSGLFEVVNLR